MNPFDVLTLALLAQVPAGTAVVQFEPYADPWETNGADLVPGACPLRLELDGVHAVDAEAALVYGEVRGSVAARSVLLRSADGGRSWSEVMAPIAGSRVMTVVFPTPTRGLALVEWVVEGPGALLVYKTNDSGKTWQEVTEVPRPHNLDAAMSFQCSSPLRCTVRLECYSGTHGHIVDTRDGGRTWRLRRSTVGPRMSVVPEDRAGDGTDWKVEDTSAGTHIRVLRRLSSSEWTTVAHLHAEYELVDRKLVQCGQGR